VPRRDDLTLHRKTLYPMGEPSSVDRELKLLLYGVRLVLVALVVVVVLGIAVWSLHTPQSPGVGHCTPTATGTICSIMQ
jgi:hypothetical protein